MLFLGGTSGQGELRPENMVLLFADTLIEDDELYQFNRQASALLGVPITASQLKRLRGTCLDARDSSEIPFFQSVQYA